VELRKFQKYYLHFIKASQRFYRQYILNFDAQFDGIPELRKIAQKWTDGGRRIPAADCMPLLTDFSFEDVPPRAPPTLAKLACPPLLPPDADPPR